MFAVASLNESPAIQLFEQQVRVLRDALNGTTRTPTPPPPEDGALFVESTLSMAAAQVGVLERLWRRTFEYVFKIDGSGCDPDPLFWHFQEMTGSLYGVLDQVRNLCQSLVERGRTVEGGNAISELMQRLDRIRAMGLGTWKPFNPARAKGAMEASAGDTFRDIDAVFGGSLRPQPRRTAAARRGAQETAPAVLSREGGAMTPERSDRFRIDPAVQARLDLLARGGVISDDVLGGGLHNEYLAAAPTSHLLRIHHPFEGLAYRCTFPYPTDKRLEHGFWSRVFYSQNESSLWISGMIHVTPFNI
jgi:hypothetical protein